MDDTRLLAELRRWEERVWQSLVDGNAVADASTLDDAFLGVYPSGFAGKAEHVGQLVQGPVVSQFDLSEFHFLPLGSDHALLSYRARFRRPSQSEEEMFVSSVWRRAGRDWVNVFSQDTPAQASEV